MNIKDIIYSLQSRYPGINTETIINKLAEELEQALPIILKEISIPEPWIQYELSKRKISRNFNNVRVQKLQQLKRQYNQLAYWYILKNSLFSNEANVADLIESYDSSTSAILLDENIENQLTNLSNLNFTSEGNEVEVNGISNSIVQDKVNDAWIDSLNKKVKRKNLSALVGLLG